MSSDQRQLKAILLRPDHPDVRLLDGTCRKITAAQALLMLKSGPYAWCGSTRRVRKMQPLEPVPVWTDCYRTTASPTIQPSIEWLREMYPVAVVVEA